jgi:hypothetical protein
MSASCAELRESKRTFLRHALNFFADFSSTLTFILWAGIATGRSAGEEGREATGNGARIDLVKQRST